MQLTRITLPARHAADVAAFYAENLGLPVQLDERTAHVRLGSTELVFEESLPLAGSHHLAFTVPNGKLAGGKTWLRGRAPLFDLDGQDEFEPAPSWNARSVYFEGPEDSVLELIARRDLDNAAGGVFSSADLLYASEVGVAVPGVRETVARLRAEAGLTSYGEEPAANFAAVGDVHGLLILVTPGRTWFPTTSRTAAAAATSVEARGGRPGTYELAASSGVRLTG
jgi:catechol-2,3-dioxygenase